MPNAWHEDELCFARSGTTALAEQGRLFMVRSAWLTPAASAGQLGVWVVMQCVSHVIHPLINDTFLKEVKGREGSSIKAQDQRIATFPIEGESP